MDAQRQLLIVTGEPSGDRLGADVLRALNVPAVAVGGTSLYETGAHLIGDIGALSSMGVRDVLGTGGRILRLAAELRRAVIAQPPRAALLVAASEFNAQLGAWLRRRGVPVLWYSPPQLWAWRHGPLGRFQRASDCVATLFRFEVEVWRQLGVRAEFVGHPALHPGRRARDDRQQSRARIGMDSEGPAIALLPGSRTREVQRLLEPLLEAGKRLTHEHNADVRVVVATDLEPALKQHVRGQANRVGLKTLGHAKADGLFAAFDVAVVKSGTGSLECAVQGAIPVIVYKTDPLTYALGRRLIRVRDVGLPNILLDESAFPELLQSDVTVDAIVAAVNRVLDNRESFSAQLRRLAPLTHTDALPAQRVAQLIEPWLS